MGPSFPFRCRAQPQLISLAVGSRMLFVAQNGLCNQGDIPPVLLGLQQRELQFDGSRDTPPAQLSMLISRPYNRQRTTGL